MNQQDLITLFRQDRETAFRQIYQIAFPKVAKVIGRSGGSLEDAKDIFHESLIILYEQCREDQLRIRGSVIAYVTGMCRNRWLNQVKQLRKEVLIDDFSMNEPVEEFQFEEDAPSHGLLNWLEKAGKKCLDMLQAVYYFKYSMQEVAEEFGFRTTRSATVQKYKCLEKVRDEVKNAQHETIPA
ncbi:MAG: sigma-70 family RNA polymerase sigma factor [Saprospiraceae bacterium]|nr:sigma-70 family RNA polymerase sigma factor [Lewinella sp.]